MVDKAHLLADSLFPEWTDRSKSDFGEFLVELFALFSEKDFWYINAFANESILRKAHSYSNVFAQVSALGYTPTLCKGATATFSLTFAAGNAATYKRGDLTVMVGDIPFTNDEDFNVPAEETTLTLLLHAGTFTSEDITFNGNNIFIRQKNIDVDSVFVQINNVEYTRVGTFGESDSDSTHFMVLPEEDGSVSSTSDITVMVYNLRLEAVFMLTSARATVRNRTSTSPLRWRYVLRMICRRERSPVLRL